MNSTSQKTFNILKYYFVFLSGLCKYKSKSVIRVRNYTTSKTTFTICKTTCSIIIKGRKNYWIKEVRLIGGKNRSLLRFWKNWAKALNWISFLGRTMFPLNRIISRKIFILSSTLYLLVFLLTALRYYSPKTKSFLNMIKYFK